MITAYKQVQAQTHTPTELSRNVFNSIRLYLQEYKDTSRPKAIRIKAIESAYMITYWAVGEMSKNITGFESEIVYLGFSKILDTVDLAAKDHNKVYDVTEAISFLKIIATEK